MSRHTRVDHAETAAALREQPGVWLPVAEYRNSLTANTVDRIIRTASGGKPHTGRPYEPAGSFETRTQLTDDGTLLEARYVGDRRSLRSDRIQMSPDTERVLGQIERGEIRCDAEAARQIAARHQAAYGDAVWADALASLSTTTKGDAA
ncbi:hypothetical protein [Streptomyces sp. YKOK-I1]